MLAETVAATSVGANVVRCTGVANPLDRARRVRGVLFDLDGTLYRQNRLRALMAIELAAAAVASPWRAPRVARALSAYRTAQELVRRDARPAFASTRQLELAAERAGMPKSEIASIVAEWMIDRPLKHLPRCRAAGLDELLAFLVARKVAIGVLSDYPAASKLQALGLNDAFSVVLVPDDPDVGVFKPNPRGFCVACDRWQLPPADVLVVGDRVDVDAAGAAAANMPCVIVARSRPTEETFGAVVLPSLERLRCVLDND